MDSLLSNNFIPTKKASEITGYHSEYLARLAREKKIVGRQLGRMWLIDRSSLNAFMTAQEEKKKGASRALTQMREKEYQLAQTRREQIKPYIQAKSVKQARRHARTMWGQVHAISIAVVVMACAMHFSHVIESAPVWPRVISLADETAFGFHSLVADAAQRVESYGDVGAANALGAVLEARFASQEIAIGDVSNDLIEPDVSVLQTRIDSPAPQNGFRKNPTFSFSSTPLEFSFSGLVAAAASPTDAINALGGALWSAYVSLGLHTYGLIAASMDGYLSLIQKTGETTLAFSAGVRDLAASAPGALSHMNLALGGGIISLAHQAIAAEVALVYGLSDAAPKSAEATFALIVNAGDTLERGTAHVPLLATGAYLGTAQVLADAAPTAADAVWSAEYAFGKQTVRAADHTLALIKQLAPASSNDTALLAAAAAPVEHVNIFATIWEWLFGRPAFSPTPTRVATSTASHTISNQTVLTATSTSQTVTQKQTKVITVISPTYTTVVHGASQVTIDAQLAAFRNDILETARTAAGTVASQVAADQHPHPSSSLHDATIDGDATFSGTSVTTDSLTVTGALSVDSLDLTNALAVSSGGTGSTTLSGILAGDGTNPLKTLAIGSGLSFDGSTLSASGGGGGGSGNVSTSTTETAGALAYWTSTAGSPATLGTVSTTTFSFSGPFTTAGSLGSLVGGADANISYYGLATTSNIAQSQLLYGTSASGVASVATSSVSGGTGISLGGTGAVVGGSLTITNTGVTAIAGTANQITTSAGSGNVTLSIPTQFTIQNASTTNLSANTLAVGGTGTTSVSSTGALTVPSLSIGSLSGFLKATTGVVSTALVNLASDITGILSTTNGGTGWNSLQANTVLLGNGAGAIATTSAGIDGQVLALVNGLPTWVSTTTLATISGTLEQAKGGTGLTSYNPGDILYADAGGNVTTLPIGSAGTILKVTGGLPAWGTDLTSGGGGGAGAWATTSDSLAIYPTDTSNVVIVGSSATSTSNSLFEVHGGSYFSSTLGIGTTSPASAFKLNVQGSGLFSGNISAANLTATGTATLGALTVSGNTTLIGATTTALFARNSLFNVFAAGQTGTTSISSTGALTTPSLTLGSLSGILYGNGGVVSSVATSSLGIDFSSVNQTNRVGSPTQLNNLLDIFNTQSSAGIVQGGDLTDNGNGTVSIAAGQALLRSSATATSTLYSVSFNAQSNIALTNNSINYVYLDYNSGSPTFNVGTSLSSFNCQNKCLAYTIVREGTSLSIINASEQNVDPNRKDRRRLLETSGFQHVFGGSTLGASGTRNISVTSGAFYYGLNRIDHNAFDTSGGDTFAYYYSDGASGWTKTTGNTQIDNTQYDDGDGTLGTLSNNRYGVFWVYLVNGTTPTLAVQYGAGNYQTIADAQAASVPTAPPAIQGAGSLLGRIIIRKSATTFAVVESAVSNTFTASTATNHNGLAGLQGGATDEYYHLTSSEYTGTGTGIFVRATSPTLSGNVGIGTTSPSSLFAFATQGNGLFSGNISAANLTATGTVSAATLSLTNALSITSGGTATTTFYNGGVVFSDGSKLTQSSAASNFFWDETNKRLGIGTSSPFATLSVSGTLASNAIIPNGPYTNNLSAFDLGAATSRWNALWAGTFNIGTSTWSMTTGTNGRLSIFDQASGAGSERLTILTNGNVGIGTTSPVSPLSVNGLVTLGASATSSATSPGSISYDGVDFYAKTGTATTTSTGWFALGDNKIDVFLVAGQSNAVGLGDSSLSPVPVAGTAYSYYNGTISPATDPVGPAVNGSAWPAFAQTYYNATGHKIAFVSTAVGGTGQEAAAGGAGNWDTSGTLFGNSTTTLAAAMVAFRQAGFSPSFKGILWNQGERDAIGINDGTPGVSKTNYIAAFQTMVANYRALYGPSMPFYIFKTGNIVGDPVNGFDQIRAAQDELALSDPYTKIVFSEAAEYSVLGLLQVDGAHYTQPGYNRMGAVAAANIVSGLAYTFFQHTATTTATSTIYYNGYVGIGSTTPRRQLTVSGTENGQNVWVESSALNTGVTLYNSSTGGRQWGLLSSGGSAIVPSSFRLYDWTALVDRFDINSSGSVGIGSTSPWALLSVNPNGISGPAFAIGSSTATNFIVTNAGNVGVGTTTPGYRFDVWGTANSGDIFIGPWDVNSSFNAINLNGLKGVGNYNFVSSQTQTNSTLFINRPSGGDISFRENNADQVTFKTGGNVGVSSSTPWGLLSVNANALGAGVPQFVVGSSTATNFIVTNGGLVGVGTTSPASTFAVQGTNNQSLTFGTLPATSFFGFAPGGVAPAAATYVFAVDGIGSTNTTILNNPGGNVALRTANTNRVVILAGGNIGVGTTTPFVGFEIASTSANSGAFGQLALTDTNGGTNLKHWLFTSEKGNLYIGTTTDTYATSTPAALTISNAGVVTLAGALSAASASFTTALPVSSGGTGFSSYTPGDILYANSATSFAKVASSTDGFVLALANGKPSWVATTTLSTISGTLGVSKGGTGDATFSSGQLLYGNGTAALSSAATSSLATGASLSVSGTLGAQVGGSNATISLNLANSNWWTALQNFTNASTSQFTATSSVYLATQGGSVGIGATSTPGSLLSIQGIANFTTGTSTFYGNGINLTNGCFAINGTCIGGGSGSVGGSGSTNQIAYWSNSSTLTSASNLTFDGTTLGLPALINFSAKATTTIPNNSLYAWTIATSTTASPLFRIDTTSGSEQVVLGTRSSDVIIGDVGAAANLIFEENSFIKGQGAGRTLTFGANSDILNFAVKTGVGTSSPFVSLDIASTSANSGPFGQLALTDTNGGTNLKHWLFTSEKGNLYIGTTTDTYATSTPAALTILNGGSVGIGTSTPGSLFSIAGVANFTTGTTTFYGNGLNIPANKCYAVNGTCLSNFSNTLANGGTATSTFYNGGVVFSDGSKLTQSSAASNFFWDETNKRLGLGTTTPQSPLHVQGSIAANDLMTLQWSSASTNPASDFGGLALINADTTNNNYSSIWFPSFDATGVKHYNSAIQSITVNHTTGSSILAFRAGDGTEKLRIDNTGNVGIGTTTPASLLSVQGNGLFSGNIAAANITATGTVTASSFFWGGSSLQTQTSVAAVELHGSDTTHGAFIDYGSSVGDYDFRTIYNEGSNIFQLISSTTANLLTALPNGKVGIGTASPGYNLTVRNDTANATTTLTIENRSGTGTTTLAFAAGNSDPYSRGAYIESANTLGQGTNQLYLAFGTSNGTVPTERMRITHDGNIQFGTTSNAYPFSIYNSLGRIYLRNTGDTDSSTLGGALFTANTGKLTIQGASAEGSGTAVGFTLDYANQRLGIGSTTPFAKLAVTGAGTGTGVNFQTTDSSNAPLFTILDNGSVLVNATTTFSSSALTAPKLQVTNTGDASIGQNTFTNTAAGFASRLQLNRSRGTVPGDYTVTQINDALGSIDFSGSDGSDLQLAASIRGYVDASPGAGKVPGYLSFHTADAAGGTLSERARIDSVGKFGIATTSPWRTLSVTGTVGFDGLTATSTVGNDLCLSSNKEVTLRTGANCAGSSQRFKEDINALAYTSGLREVMALNPVSFKYTQQYLGPFSSDPNWNGEFVGFIAEQVKNIDPRLITADPDGTPNNVRYQNITAILTEAIQDVNRGYTLNNLGFGATSTVASFYEGSSTPAITVGSGGSVGIMTNTPHHTLEVNGDVGADAFVVPTHSWNENVLAMGLASTSAPSAILTADGAGVDIAKLATLALVNLQDLSKRTDLLTTRMNSLESRIAMLEDGSVSMATSTPLFSSSTLASALNGLGVLITAGVAEFNRLVAYEFVASTATDGTSSAGNETILAGNTVIEVHNTLAKPATKVFVTFNSPVEGSWYVTNKQSGSFRVVLTKSQLQDVSFDYFLVQTEGQISPGAGTGSTSSSTQSAPTPPPSEPSTPDTSSNTNSSTTSPSDTTTSAPIVDNTSGSATSTAATTTPPSSDVTPPTISLNGDAAIQVYVGDTFTDPGATATDDVDGDLTSYVHVSGSVDTSTAGLYTLTYSVTDASGNSADVSRAVAVVEPPSSQDTATTADNASASSTTETP